MEVPASTSQAVIPVPLSAAAAVDPEEAFVAARSGCRMLSFLAVAAKEGFGVDTYRDDAEGVLARDASGGSSISVVGLRPRITFAGGRRPTPAEFEAFHHESHESCFIARSVESEVRWVAAFQRRGQADRKSMILMHE